MPGSPAGHVERSAPISGALARMMSCAQDDTEQEARMIERIETGTRMSKIVKHNGVVYLCGQVGDGSTVTEQTRDCLGRVDALLAKAGSSREKMLQAVIWLADIADYDEMNAVWDAWVPAGHAPARACGEARLASPELKVEVIVTAAC
jgi:enamine deaminase RidA (YjgF/YER057c/UK114 family)